MHLFSTQSRAFRETLSAYGSRCCGVCGAEVCWSSKCALFLKLIQNCKLFPSGVRGDVQYYWELTATSRDHGAVAVEQKNVDLQSTIFLCVWSFLTLRKFLFLKRFFRFKIACVQSCCGFENRVLRKFQNTGEPPRSWAGELTLVMDEVREEALLLVKRKNFSSDSILSTRNEVNFHIFGTVIFFVFYLFCFRGTGGPARSGRLKNNGLLYCVLKIYHIIWLYVHT